jgi:hypothetical protein
VLDYDDSDCDRASTGRLSASLSVVWNAVRIILGIHIDIADARLRPGMVRRGVPNVINEFYPAELLHLHAAPVGGGATRFKRAGTLAAVLVNTAPASARRCYDPADEGIAGEEDCHTELKPAFGLSPRSGSVGRSPRRFESLPVQQRPSTPS